MRGVVAHPEELRTIRFGSLTAWNVLAGADGSLRKVRFVCDCGGSLEVEIKDIRFSALYNRINGKSLMPTQCPKCGSNANQEK